MAEKFGLLLRKWRKLSDLTQTGLVKELRLKIENECYSKSDISKWEHGRIPPEDIIEELDEILSTPQGLLLKAAGYTLGEKLKDDQPDQRHYAHWGSLSKLAEELIQGLELPNDYKIVDTAFGIMIQVGWCCREGNIYFSVQNSALWECLLQHLDNEFESPHFSYVLKKFQQIAAQLLNGKPEGHPVMVRSYQLAQNLSYELWVVIERGTFIGTCDICKEWDRPPP